MDITVHITRMLGTYGQKSIACNGFFRTGRTYGPGVGTHYPYVLFYILLKRPVHTGAKKRARRKKTRP